MRTNHKALYIINTARENTQLLESHFAYPGTDVTSGLEIDRAHEKKTREANKQMFLVIR